MGIREGILLFEDLAGVDDISRNEVARLVEYFLSIIQHNHVYYFTIDVFETLGTFAIAQNHTSDNSVL